ncbi:MAG: outer membrane beta-barrel protein, partial [Deltaproteobacteria bacterium]|nr:outer membrane beta-barrel protein [Deltaproteobacteria bacterium]
MKSFLFSSLCVVLIVSMSVSMGMAVESRKGTYSVSAGIGGYHFESNQCYREDEESFNPIFTFGFGLGYNFTDNWTTELLFHYIDAEYKD